MPSRARNPRYPFRWHHILLVGLIRLFTTPGLWLTKKKRIHDGVVLKRITVPSRDKGRNIKVDIYFPEGYDSKTPTPALVHWHGSGFIMEAFSISREFCALIAARTQSVVFDADYRKAPRHPFPAAVRDAEDVAHYVARNSDRYDSSNIFLSGFSSGGNIALVIASTLGPERVKGVIGFYPIVDLTQQHTAPEKHILAGYTIPHFIYDACFGTYIPPGQPRNDPRISVITAPTESFPRHVYLACGDADLLYNPAAKFVERLKKAGHMDAEFVRLECMGHSFDMFENNDEAVRNKAKAYGGAVEMMNRVIGARGGSGSDFDGNLGC